MASEYNAAMTLQINHPEFEKLANALAAQTGETPTEAVLSSLRARLNLREAGKKEDAEQLGHKIQAIAEHYKSLPVIDTRTDEEILGYGENGLPS